MIADFSAEQNKFEAALAADQKSALAQKLGVSISSLEYIGIGRATGDDLRRLRAGGAGWRNCYPLCAFSFPERDAKGNIIGFGFRADDGRKGAPSQNAGGKRGLVIPSTLAHRSDPVLLVEGPSDVAACETLCIASVGRPSNSAGGEMLAELLAGRSVLVVGENDQKASGSWPGCEGAQKIASYLAAKWKHPVTWTLPPAGHKDVRAYLLERTAKGFDTNDEQACREEGKLLLEALRLSSKVAAADSDKNGELGARDRLLGLCEESGDQFLHDNENRAFVTVRERGGFRTYFVRSREYEQLLCHRFHRATGQGLPAAAKVEAISTLESLANFEGPEEPVFIRIGEYGDKVVLDLCDELGQVVVVDRKGWQVVQESPVRFRRARGMLPLPVPTPGGSINDFRPFLNVPSDLQFVLVCAFIVGCFNPRGPFTILLVNGEAGTAKSTMCRLIRSLIDPNKAPLRCASKDERDLAIAANNAWMLGLDNMSSISERISNALCRVATGGGFTTRGLYTDADEAIFDATRPIIINGIGEVAERGDLMERALRLTLELIPDQHRKTEREIGFQFEKKRPAILGAFLEAVSTALRNRDNIRVSKLPRMADAASWVVAAESSCPWAPGAFLNALENQRRDTDEYVVEANPVANAVRQWVETQRSLEGTATAILEKLSVEQDQKKLKDPAWPKSVAVFGTQLREAAPSLRRIGIEVEFVRNASCRKIKIAKT